MAYAQMVVRLAAHVWVQIALIVNRFVLVETRQIVQITFTTVMHIARHQRPLPRRPRRQWVGAHQTANAMMELHVQLILVTILLVTAQLFQTMPVFAMIISLARQTFVCQNYATTRRDQLILVVRLMPIVLVVIVQHPRVLEVPTMDWPVALELPLHANVLLKQNLPHP
jgi:hypothetical protein